MGFSSPYSPKAREAVLALVRAGGLSQAEIAERTGIPRGTVATWAVRREAKRADADPRHWAAMRREAAARLLACPGVDPRDVATVARIGRSKAGAVFVAAGLCGPKRGAAPPVARLSAALRRHIARQIAVFDAALDAPPAGLDSAKVLRDLGGLKRLLDDVARDAPESAKVRDGDADERPVQDLAALRESLARRYEGFVRARGIPSVLEGPAAGGTEPAGAGLAVPGAAPPEAAAG